MVMSTPALPLHRSAPRCILSLSNILKLIMMYINLIFIDLHYYLYFVEFTVGNFDNRTNKIPYKYRDIL